MLFNNIYHSIRSRARLGEIRTSHGTIKTPAFVPVGTKGTIKTLLPSLIPEIGIQVAFVNTYHLVTHPGADVIESAGGIHNFSQLDIPLMSDSGGFQVFSLANNINARHHVLNPPHPKGAQAIGLKMMSSLSNNEQRRAKLRGDDSVGTIATQHKGEESPLVVKISDDGVKFRSTYDGQLIEFTPEKSMEFQRKIGADLNMAFDECTYYPATHEYAEKAMERTHEWLERCIQYKKKARHHVLNPPHPKGAQAIGLKMMSSPLYTHTQYLYGIIQGGTFEDLRKKSADLVVSQNVDGIAIGGVSVGETKKEMREQVKWVADYLPKDKPVHLLGVGQIDDIVDLVKHGIDTFDCVEPTRLARMGVLLSNQFLKNKGELSKKDNTDITRTEYKNNLEFVDEDCNCYVCTHFTKAYLHHLFKQREILGYNLATYHNLFTMEKLFTKLREMIGNDLI